jgi:hypothetical protein
MWKVLHLLYVHGKPGISASALRKAGIMCDPDTLYPLVNAGAIEERPVARRSTPDYVITPASSAILQNCLVANRGSRQHDVHVDTSNVFVVMPFSESWSDDVYAEMIKPAIEAAKLVPLRGDDIVRVGDLSANISNQILQCGVVIAEVTKPNVNVYYELGLVHALGKDTILLKQEGQRLPADFGGAHFYEYRPDALAKGRRLLAKALRDWASSHYVRGVMKIAAGAGS